MPVLGNDTGKTTAKPSVKSGVPFDDLPTVMGGMPPKKSVDQIDKANMPENAPNSYSPGK